MSDRKVRIALSRDGAYNFGDWRTRDLGALGQYRHRVIFTMLGDGVQLVLRHRITSPIRTDCLTLVTDLEPGE